MSPRQQYRRRIARLVESARSWDDFTALADTLQSAAEDAPLPDDGEVLRQFSAYLLELKRQRERAHDLV